MSVQPFLFGNTWIEVKDGNDSVRSIFDAHYSRYHYADGRKPLLFVGPGEKMVLMTPDARAIFAWRRFISADGQQGINCAIFRNEGPQRSSDLIRAADLLADRRWSGERHYTYVNPKKIRSSNPGYCAAGWRFCGITRKRNYHILERT